MPDGRYELKAVAMCKELTGIPDIDQGETDAITVVIDREPPLPIAWWPAGGGALHSSANTHMGSPRIAVAFTEPINCDGADVYLCGCKEARAELGSSRWTHDHGSFVFCECAHDIVHVCFGLHATTRLHHI